VIENQAERVGSSGLAFGKTSDRRTQRVEMIFLF
jgi:hypothetical protein